MFTNDIVMTAGRGVSQCKEEREKIKKVQYIGEKG
jgi:hypothetical protein